MTGLSDNGRMKIQLLSDLHLEANPDFVPVPAPGADLLVLAGDIGSYQTRRDGSVMNEPDWGLQRFSPLPQYAGWPTPVVFVPGNHEYDALDVDEAHADLRKACDRLGIQWLERETLQMQGVRLIGTTLWSDYDALGEHAPEPTPARHSRAGAVQAPGAPDPLTHRLRQREKAFRAANHYLHKDGRPAGTAACSTPRPCARSPWTVRPGCARRWPSPSTAPPWSSPTSRPRCTAWTRATA